jgi:hypothetical protein
MPLDFRSGSAPSVHANCNHCCDAALMQHLCPFGTSARFARTEMPTEEWAAAEAISFAPIELVSPRANARREL